MFHVISIILSKKLFFKFSKFPIEKNRLSYFASKFPIGGNRHTYFASKFPIKGNHPSYFGYGSHDMRSCYRSTASETVAPNCVTVRTSRPDYQPWPQNFQNEKNFKVFLKTIFLHVSCDFNHFEQKTFFQIFQISN